VKYIPFIKRNLIFIACVSLVSFYLYAGILILFYPNFIFKEDPQQGDFLYWYIINVLLFFFALPIEILLFILLDIIQFETRKAFYFHLLCLGYIALYLLDPGGIIVWVLD
jgi:hypothetical protein